MLHTILPTQMQAAEQTAFAAGLSPLLTMETAARAAFDVLLDLLGCDCRGKNVLFLCGPGNNGGDGLVMAPAAAGAGLCAHHPAGYAQDRRGADQPAPFASHGRGY